ncbi:MAG TPA: acyl-CoA desaturase, partial [Kofleriaceae bacterium]|nr:acyl-CoA desaturase [Kofleriaceae bacterium]
MSTYPGASTFPGTGSFDRAPDAPTGPLSRRRRVLRDASIRAAQRHHFLLFDVAPAAAAVIAIPVLWHLGLTAVGVALFAVMWVLNLIGIEVGYHRLFSHGAFEARPSVRAALVVLGSMGAQGPVVSWAANHRHHHQHSDTPEDTHSPHGHGGDGWRARVRAFVHAHLTWKWGYDYPSPSHYTPALLRDPVVIRTSRRYTTWIALGLIAPAVAGGLITWSLRGAVEGLLTGGVLRLVLGQHATWCINSLCHLVGSRPFRTGDRSTNNAWLALPTLGGSWHNNHHAFPTTASNQLAWWQLDPCYWVIAGLARLGLVADVKVPTADAVRAKRAAS